MEVSNVRSHAISGSFLGHRCLIDGCSQRSMKVLTFTGDNHNLHSIFGDITSYSSKYDACYVCCCVDHMCYLELLGHTMAIYRLITKQIVDSVLHVNKDRISGMITDYKGYIMIRYLLGIAQSEDGVSRGEICDFIARILRYYVENINITIYQNPKYLKILGENFTQIHDRDAITLFIELKRKFKNIVLHPQYSEDSYYFVVVTNEMLEYVQHSKLVNVLRIRTCEYS